MLQNAETLKALGFQPTPNSREFVWRGKYQRFIAITNESEHPPFVSMFLVSKIRDSRRWSPRKGHYLRYAICDCTKDGSVEKAIEKFDVGDNHLYLNSMSIIRK